MMHHIIEPLLEFGNHIGGTFGAVMIGMVTFILGMLILPILIGFLSIYVIFTTENNILRVGLILFLALPYIRVIIKTNTKRLAGSLERSIK